MKRSILGPLAALFLASLALAAGNSPGTVRYYGDEKADAYVLVLGNQWTSTNISIDDIPRLRRLSSGDFLWFRRSRRSYLIRDEALLRQAKDFFAPLRSLDPEREEIRRRERALDRKEQAFDREEEELDRIRDGHDDEDDEEGAEPRTLSEAERRELEIRSEHLHALRRTLREEQREIQALESAFDRKEDELEKKAEGELWRMIDRAIADGRAVPLERKSAAALAPVPDLPS